MCVWEPILSRIWLLLSVTPAELAREKEADKLSMDGGIIPLSLKDQASCYNEKNKLKIKINKLEGKHKWELYQNTDKKLIGG